MNLLNCFGSDPEYQVHAFTTRSDGSASAYEHSRVTITRTAFPTAAQPALIRLLSFTLFPLAVFLRLLWWRPQVLLYFEPHSALPAWLYCTLHRKCRLFIHYHEYREPHEYQRRGMRLIAWYHLLERKFLFRRAEWISHTNSDRVRMFLDDNPAVDPRKMRVMANRPPQEWFTGQRQTWPSDATSPLKLVYVGAVSLHDTFVEAFIRWVSEFTDRPVEFDIYTNNTDSKTDTWLQSLKIPNLRYFRRGIDYWQLPVLLHRYHVGLILYRGNTPNYIFNAPNKLFEYLACGLDVWYPKQMLGIRPFAQTEFSPRVVELDFENLHQAGPPLCACQSTIDVPQISCQEELQPLFTQIIPR